jgi:putative ABC transport system permease protein
MFFLSRQTVRRHLPLYAGSFVALAVGVFLLGLAATATAATIAYHGPAADSVLVNLPGVDGSAPHQERVLLSGADASGLQIVLSLVGVISGFITVFVIASTFAFAVASRRREVGLLRLIGATPRQVRRMVLGEALVVAVAASLTGALLAQLFTPLVLAKASYTELAPVKLEAASPWLPLAIAVAVGLVVALLGARSAARRAGRVGPVDALREAALEPPRIGVIRVLFGLLFLAGGIVMLALIQPGTGEGVVPLAMFTPMILVVSLTLLGPLVVPWIGRLWALPLVRWTQVSGRLARSNVVAAPRRSASLAAPILAISAIAGAMVLSLSFAADAAGATMRDTLTAPIVIMTTENSGDVRERILATPGVAAADGGLGVKIIRADGDAAELEGGEGIDPAVAARTRALHPLSGDLADLTGNTVAISKEMAGLNHYRVGSEIPVVFGDRTKGTLRVVAVLPDASGVNGSMLVSQELAKQHAPGAVAEHWFIRPADGVDTAELIGALDRQLTGTGAHVVRAEEWERQQTDGLRKANQLGLVMLLGPAAIYSAIAIANTLLMGSLQRRHEFVTSRLLGATPAQIRRMVLWESSLVGATALTLGAVTTVTVGILLRHAMTEGLQNVPTTIPWAPLLGIAALCLVLAVGAASAPTAYILRRTSPADAVGD